MRCKLFISLTLFYFSFSSLSAQVIPAVYSGYSGFLWNIQTGAAYTELILKKPSGDNKIFCLGYQIGTQIGYAFGGKWAIHLDYTAFISGKNSITGNEIIERVDENLISKTEQNLNLWTAGAGFTWFNVPKAYYLTLELHPFQRAVYKAVQNDNVNLVDGDAVKNTTYTYFTPNGGAGFKFGKDQWFSKHFGMGFGLSYSYDIFLTENIVKHSNRISDSKEVFIVI